MLRFEIVRVFRATHADKGKMVIIAVNARYPEHSEHGMNGEARARRTEVMAMQTPDAIKKSLSCCCEHDCIECPYKDCDISEECYVTLKGDALDYINQLEQRIAIVGKTFPEWISVKDMLPEYYKDVLVIVRNNGALFTIIAYLTIGGIWVHKGFGRVIGVVHHWMPLPEPPKEDNHE